MPEAGRLARRSYLVRGREEGNPHEPMRLQRETTPAIPLPFGPVSDDSGAFERAGKVAANCAPGHQNPFSVDTGPPEATSLLSESHASIDRSLHTPTKSAPDGSMLRSGANGKIPAVGCTPRTVTPTAAFTTATGEVWSPLTDRSVVELLLCLLPSVWTAAYIFSRCSMYLVPMFEARNRNHTYRRSTRLPTTSATCVECANLA